MNLNDIDTSTLSQSDQMKLAVFHQAYRPHSINDIPSRKFLKAEAKPYFDTSVSTMDEIKEQSRTLDVLYYQFLESVTRDEDGNIIDDAE